MPRCVRYELEQTPAYPGISQWEAERTFPYLLAWLRADVTVPPSIGSGLMFIHGGRNG